MIAYKTYKVKPNRLATMFDGIDDAVPRDQEVADALRALVAVMGKPPNKYKIGFVPMITRAIELRERRPAQPYTALNAPTIGQEGMRRLDAVLRNITIICEQRNMTLSKNQIHAILQCIIVCMPKITGPDQYAQFSAEYFKFLGIRREELDNPALEKHAEETQQNCRSFRIVRMMILIMARQCGKTTVIGIALAAIIAACTQGLEIGIFAPVQRQSDLIFTEICNNLVLLGHACKHSDSPSLLTATQHA